ncbi:hypothetical protein K501DRAFT_338966 [Backusella circina FSU 941]|nr:hypothetical protein K501DRAFT_338966 [Backusella circina FSU 941]
MISLQEGTYPFPPFSFTTTLRSTSPLFYVPTLLLLFTVIVGSCRYYTTKSIPWDYSVSPNRKLGPLSKLIIVLSCLVTITFVADTVVIVTRAFLNSGFSLALCYYTGISWLAWATGIFFLINETYKFSQWHWLQYTFYGMVVVGESLVGWLWLMGVKYPIPGTIYTVYDRLLFAFFIARYILEIFVFLFSLFHMCTHERNRGVSETAPLLSSAATGENYGSSSSNDPVSTGTYSNKSGFSDFFVKLRKVMPFIWPHSDRKLQLNVLLCFLLMLTGLIINVWTPLQIGSVVDKFGRGPGTFAWAAVTAYVALRFLQGGSGLIQAMQNWLWIPIGQYTTREISVKLFSHLHSLSLHYHINRKTGEVLRIVDRGTNSIVQLLSQIVFQIFPALANIAIAVVVFSIQFSLPFGLIVFVTMSLYLYTTIVLTEWRNSFRRKMNELDNYARTKAVDSLLNFETVKYYNAEGFEVDRYHNAIIEYQKADYKNSVSLNVLNLAQNAVITAGLLAGSLLFAWEVSQGTLTPGDFVAFNMYMMQLYTPLHFFGTYYRMIQQNFIDMEKMLDLFEVEETVKDAPDAGELRVTEGRVVFDRVTFAYDNRQTALNGISFTIPKGATVALVGPSGGGKSTILRLLFRFYDPSSGHIYIDGQDIAGVKQSSLRQNIGVVPQDTVLFNDTILYNIRYGDVNASDEDVFRAAKAAQIHDKILSFPDGYDTKVGERGLRLSGGEKQRVAIARTILKNPPIILLDEATSALDTTTERYIQEALADMTKDRTTLVIAHRLSTIVAADLILVIKDGQVVESGSHEELIQKAASGEVQGVYYEMWQKQLDDHQDASRTVSGTSSPQPEEQGIPKPINLTPMVTLEHDDKKQTAKDIETMEVMVAAETEVPKITTPFKTEEVEIFENADDVTTTTDRAVAPDQTESANNNDSTDTPLTVSTSDQPAQAQEFTSSPVDTEPTTAPEVTQTSSSNTQGSPAPSPSRSTRRNNKKKKRSKSKR